MMENIIVRDKILEMGHVNSAYISLCNEKIFDSAEALLNEYEINIIMKELYDEDILCDRLFNSDLYKSYNRSLQTVKDSECFKIMYKIDEDFAVHLTENIYLYHLVPVTNEIYSNIVPWVYADSKIFLGDTWWEEDEEILGNLKCLSVVEFMRKYKGY